MSPASSRPRQAQRGALPDVARALLCALLLLCALPACSSAKLEPSVFVHPNADFSLYKTVAVLPFENLSTERFAAERVRELLVVELASLDYFQLVETGEVNRVLRARNLSGAGEIGPELIKSLGTDLKSEALLTGSVIEFREQREGTLNAPDIALSLKLVDVDSGLVIWSVTAAREGLRTMTRLFGVGEENQTTAARRLIRELLQTMG
jgi:TolB-like protein